MSAEKQTLLFTNCHVLTIHEGPLKTWDWLYIQNGLVEQVGNGQPPDVPALRLEQRKDLGGCIVLPGLSDSHLHVFALGKGRDAVDLEGCRSIEELQDRVKTHLAQMSGDSATLVDGNHWDHELLGREPTKEDLDLVLPERPAVFYRRCWHVCVANSAALRACGISADTPDVEGGVVDRDASGQPTGVLREAAMSKLLKPIMDDEGTFDFQKRALLSGLQQCVEEGITQVQTNDGKQIGNISDPWKMYSILAEEGLLPCRVFLTVPVQALNEACTPLKPIKHASGLLSCDRVKLWTDGGLGASTAALLEPYSDDKENSGVLQLSLEAIDESMAKAKAKGFRVEAHAIGDRAATVLMDAFEKHYKPEDRPVLTHCQILNRSLIDRMAKAGVVANVQPQFVPSDKPIVFERLGRDTERMRFSYPWKTLLRSGVRLAGGSDAPVEAPSPLVGMADAMDHTIHESERLSLAEALEMYTVGAAFGANADSWLGTLAPGKAADLVVLSHRGSAETLTSASLRAATVLEVYVDGRCVHKRDPLPPPEPPMKRARGDAAGKNGLMRAWRRGRCPCCTVPAIVSS